MSDLDDIRAKFIDKGWFKAPGAYALVDGQFGSTGKGAAAALIGMLFGKSIDVVTTNAGPNSGHTSYYPSRNFYVDKEGNYTKPSDLGNAWMKAVSQQIPTASIVTRALYPMARQLAYLNGGAVIEPAILERERIEYGFNANNLLVHPAAALIDGHDDAESTAKIASTNKGVGRAIARKVMREMEAVAVNRAHHGLTVDRHQWNWSHEIVFVETAQGFSLGINEGFYPYCTSRSCTVGQALADASIPSKRLNKVIMTLRTYPIRVGNTDKGTSGGWYEDQQETTWEALGVEPEITTVTKRVRRVATWSWQQFRDAVRANEPDVLWVGFMDYIKDELERASFIGDVVQEYDRVMMKSPDFVLGSYGPKPTDVKVEFAR